MYARNAVVGRIGTGDDDRDPGCSGCRFTTRARPCQRTCEIGDMGMQSGILDGTLRVLPSSHKRQKEKAQRSVCKPSRLSERQEKARKWNNLLIQWESDCWAPWQPMRTANIHQCFFDEPAKVVRSCVGMHCVFVCTSLTVPLFEFWRAVQNIPRACFSCTSILFATVVAQRIAFFNCTPPIWIEACRQWKQFARVECAPAKIKLSVKFFPCRLCKDEMIPVSLHKRVSIMKHQFNKCTQLVLQHYWL